MVIHCISFKNVMETHNCTSIIRLCFVIIGVLLLWMFLSFLNFVSCIETLNGRLDCFQRLIVITLLSAFLLYTRSWRCIGEALV